MEHSKGRLVFYVCEVENIQLLKGPLEEMEFAHCGLQDFQYNLSHESITK